MDLKSGYPYWLLKNGLPDTYPTLQKNHSCDVLIIGGGISGVLAAYHICKAGFQVTVIDRRHFGLGSTCASTAIIQYETDEHFTSLVKKYGAPMATRCHQLTLEAVRNLGKIIARHKIKCGFRQRPSLYLASNRKDRKSLFMEYDARIQAGFELEFWDAAEISEKVGIRSVAALWSEDGAELDALKLTYELIKVLRKKGVMFYDGTGVCNLSRNGKRHVMDTSTGITIKSNHVVIASGYESANFIDKKVSKLYSTYAVISEPVDPSLLWYRSCLIWESARPYLYMRTTPDNRIIVGGKDEPFYNPEKRDKLLYKKSRQLVNQFSKKFPAIPFTADFWWTGTFAETKDSLPYIDKRNGLLYVMGFGGNGITYSQMAGPLLVDLIKGHINPDLKLFSFSR